MELKKCEFCGKEFAASKKQRYCCVKCRSNRAAEIHKMRKAQAKEKEEKAKHNSITAIAAEARKHGMSYGKYLAMCAAKEE